MSDDPETTSQVELLSSATSSPFIDAWFDMASTDHFWFQWRLRATRQLLSRSELARTAPLRVLDIGCGPGVLREQLEAETAWTVDGADLDRAALEHVPTGRGRVLFYDLHDRLEAFREAYDVLVLYDVLEHIADTGPFIESLLYHLKPGGHLLLNVPALPSLFGLYDELAGHVRRYDKPSLAAEFNARSDLTLLDMRYWGLSLVPVVLLRKLVSFFQKPSVEVIARGFQPPGKAAHQVLKGMMKAETAVFRRPPLGSSLLVLARKGARD